MWISLLWPTAHHCSGLARLIFSAGWCPMSEPWVDTLTIAAHLGKSVYTIRNRAKAGVLPAVKDGRDWMFKLSEVDAALTNRTTDRWAASPRSRTRRKVT
jgi:excisionase family DNA binding protein